MSFYGLANKKYRQTRNRRVKCAYQSFVLKIALHDGYKTNFVSEKLLKGTAQYTF